MSTASGRFFLFYCHVLQSWQRWTISEASFICIYELPPICFDVREAMDLPFCCLIVSLVDSILQMRAADISNAMAKCRTNHSATLEENIEPFCHAI